MESTDLWPAHIVLVALYLRGAPRAFTPSRRAWPGVLRVMRSSGCGLSDSEAVLRASGYWAEANLIASPGLLAWAEARGEGALTPAHPGYPSMWRSFSSVAPPAVWRRGPDVPAHLVGIVGSRVVGPRVAAFARDAAEAAVRGGYGVCSGGAEGCDTFAQRGALAAGGVVVRILPYGVGLASSSSEVCSISVCAPDEPFTTANAMERNALIYAASSLSLVVHARFREGGTWHGATDALRRRLCRLAVRDDPTSPAHRALMALGAAPISSPTMILATPIASSVQRPLFAEG